MATVLVALTRSLLDACTAIGIDADAVRSAAGVAASELEDVDARIPLEQHALIWDAIVATGGDVGLAVGEHIGARALGVVGYAAERANTVAEALLCIQRFRSVVLEEAVPDVRFDVGQAILSNTLPPRFAQMRHPCEAQLSGTLTILRSIAGLHFTPTRVAFQHPRPADTRRHEELFACPMTFDAVMTEFEFDASILMRPLADANPDLHRYLVARAAELLEGVGDETTWHRQTQRAVLERLAQGEPSLDDIARALATSARTLHRRLREEETSFADILDDCRHQRALQLLRDPKLAVYQIAHLLGYSENAAFTRAFRRWTGESPESWRRRH